MPLISQVEDLNHWFVSFVNIWSETLPTETESTVYYIWPYNCGFTIINYGFTIVNYSLFQ